MRKKFISICEDITLFILNHKHLWVGKKRSIFFWIYPFYLIKSVVIAGAITQGAGLRLKRFMPPTLVSAFIKKNANRKAFSNFLCQQKLQCTILDGRSV